ncbi:MAG: putative 2OG-Fe(II) oxygenase [Pseudomonadales bacterium]
MAKSQKIRGKAFRVTRDNAAAILAEAVRLQHSGDLRGAGSRYEAVLATFPDQPDALNGLAMLDHAAGRHARAASRLLDLSARYPSHPGLYMNLGAVQTAAGDLTAAAASFRQAIELNPRYPDPYYNLGDLYLRQGDPERAIAVFDACMAAVGRQFHALAYKAHALIDAGRQDEADYLMDHDRYVHAWRFPVPSGYADIGSFNAALAGHVASHPSLRKNIFATEHGKHTAELATPPLGPFKPMLERIDDAVRWYLAQLPDDANHPMVRWRPSRWKLTSWGVVMFNRGHERPHIHPNGWLSGVFYVQLPELIDDPARRPEGWLEFGRPTPDLHFASPPILRHYQPCYGQMFLFPSYLYHGTVPFRSDQRRICVAFDIEPLY